MRGRSERVPALGRVPGGAAGLAFASYHAALDREEHTARLHAARANRLARAER